MRSYIQNHTHAQNKLEDNLEKVENLAKASRPDYAKILDEKSYGPESTSVAETEVTPS